MTKIIGLTGGIGSGKTTIANYFSNLGVPVFIADDAAKILMQSDEILNKIKDIFGPSVFEDAILQRKKLAEIVFDNSEKLEQLNAIIHPAVRKTFTTWCGNYKNIPFVIYESAILFESGNYLNCDKIITVVSPLETRIQRVMIRDKSSREQVMKIINKQWSSDQLISKSDFIITNDSLEAAKLKVENILKILNNL